jgi:hypothetical protein
MLRAEAAAWHRQGELAAKGMPRAHVVRPIGLHEVAQAQTRRGHGRGKVVELPLLGVQR